VKTSFNIGNYPRTYKQIKGTQYLIHKTGFVINNITGKKVKGRDNGKGYLQVSLNKVEYYIHRLVAIYFIPNPEKKPQVHHKDFVRSNNQHQNLKWVTNKENNQYKTKKFFATKSSGKMEGVPF
jgi:hypothetical protein